jgi:hypothetical protein
MKSIIFTAVFLAIGAIAAPAPDVANNADALLNPTFYVIIAPAAYKKDAHTKRSVDPEGIRVKIKRDEWNHLMKRV